MYPILDNLCFDLYFGSSCSRCLQSNKTKIDKLVKCIDVNKSVVSLLPKNKKRMSE
jgi:hypothetical protein